MQTCLRTCSVFLRKTEAPVHRVSQSLVTSRDVCLQDGPVQRPEQPGVHLPHGGGAGGLPEEGDVAAVLRAVHGRAPHPRRRRDPRLRLVDTDRHLHEEVVPHGPRHRHVPQQRHATGGCRRGSVSSGDYLTKLLSALKPEFALKNMFNP